jgi:quercetin dioxygenase-like cupin family protein
MIASHVNNIKLVDLYSDAYKNVKGKVLISPACGSDEMVLRLFEVGKDGYSANHDHDYPHYVYVVEGEGYVELDHQKYPIEAGSFSFIPPGVQHQLVNTAQDGTLMKFLCMVPVRGHIGFGD